MEIVATDECKEGIYAGEPPDRYLLRAGWDRRGAEQGRVLDTRQGILYPPRFIHSLLARGGWHEFTGEQAVLEALLDQVVAYDSWDELRKDQAARRNTG